MHDSPPQHASDGDGIRGHQSHNRQANDRIEGDRRADVDERHDDRIPPSDGAGIRTDVQVRVDLFHPAGEGHAVVAREGEELARGAREARRRDHEDQNKQDRRDGFGAGCRETVLQDPDEGEELVDGGGNVGHREDEEDEHGEGEGDVEHVGP